MFAQLALGIFMFFRGMNHFSVKATDKSEAINMKIRNRERRRAFYRAIGKVQMSLGILFVVMGQVEYHIHFEDIRIFIGIYVVLGGAHLGLILKYRREFFHREDTLK